MIKAIKEETNKKVTVKHRIGIDGKGILDESFEKTLFESYEDLKNFVDIIMEAKPHRLVVHARIAILAGLSPKENREIPPVRYEEVYRLKREYPDIEIEINGGIKTEEQIKEHLSLVDAVMIGREAYDNPFFMKCIDKFYGLEENPLNREELALRMIPYIEDYEKKGYNSNAIIRHMLGLYHGVKGAKVWKNALSSPIIKKLGGKQAIIEAIKKVK
jgi:tRNA-dihydrouridine synthase A